LIFPVRIDYIKYMEFQTVKYAALCLTHNCNLRCRYCYAGDKIKNRMTYETACRALDFLHSQSGGECIITFFGGEPLLEFNLIKKIIKYSKAEYGEALAFRMSTNGTLLDKKKLEYLAANKIFFVLSIDGGKEQHDAVRHYADQRGSYDIITSKLADILAINPYTIAVSVIVPETVQYLAEGVKSLFEHGFRYVLQTLDYSAVWKKKDIAALKRQYKEMAGYYFEELKKGHKIYYSPFDERIKTWAQKPYGKGDLCDLANSQIAIAASGQIYPCVQFVGNDDEKQRDNGIGDVFTGFDKTRRAYYIEQNYMEKETCRECALNGRCATYCGCVNWRATGQLNQIPPIICEHERMLMPIVDRTASRLWKKNVELFRRKFYDKSFAISSYIEDCMISPGGTNAQNSQD